jgi:8-oxo-dGTP pyrophosphatase MutT (NUDIX family)
MPLKPEVTVAALAERSGRFLVVEERIKGRLVFNQPAGHVETGETLLQAVAREAREETAWRFTPQHLIGAYLLGGARRGPSILRFAFAGTVDDHRPGQPLDRGILGAHWLTRAELAERQPRLRSPLVLRCIDDYLAGRRHPLDLVAYLDLDTARSVEAKAVSVRAIR